MWRGVVVLGLGTVALFVAACSGAGTDPAGSNDAGFGPAPLPDGPETACTLANCICSGGTCRCPNGDFCGGFVNVDGCNPDSSSCELDCAGKDCRGTCGRSCNLECADASCEVVAADNTSFQCAGGANCNLRCVGDGCSAHCEPGADCALSCTGSCDLDCDPTATCRIRCEGGEWQNVVDNADC